MNRTLKLSLLCGGIFLSGAVAGGFATRHLGRFNPQPRPESFGPQQLRRLAEGLDLTTEQRDTIGPILQKAGDDLKVMRKESIARATQVIEAMDAAVAAVLTPVQRERLATLRAEDRARMKTLMEERQRRMAEREGDKTHRREGADARRPKPPGEPGTDAAATPPQDAPPPPPEETKPGKDSR
jgi:Spy/CpxP family protein refolding chaperone